MNRAIPLWFSALAMAQGAFGAETVKQETLTLEGARHAADAAIAYARQHGAPGAAVAVVDAGGHPMYLERLDGTFAAGAEISIGKARTAVMFKRPTRGIEETINKGRTAMTPLASVTWFTPLQGGVPIQSGDQIVGAIGVSGASSAQQDEEVAIAGAQSVQGSRPAAEVRHIPADAVARTFDAGTTGGNLLTEPALRVEASRRDGAGEAEVHTVDTDILYVLDGSAVVVTGGTLIAPHQVAPGEIRGSGIEGGSTHQLAKGDVFTIPDGVPHWFKTVKTPFRYYVIKSATGA
jgi:glc operon protein GlcG